MLASAFAKRRKVLFGLGLVLGVLLTGRPASAQSLTSGSLRGTVQSADGEPVSGAAVTLESSTGAVLLSLESGREGTFDAQLLTPGEYRILVEQIGYQPLRAFGVIVTAGATTVIVLRIERRPPPITSVTEVNNPGARGGAAAGYTVSRPAIAWFDRPGELGGVARRAASLIAPGDGRAGLGLGAGGLPITDSRLFVDGVQETLLRHPAYRTEPLQVSVFQRNAINQVQFLGLAGDAEWRGVPGMVISAQSRNGSGRRLAFAPYATFSSSSLGQNSLDNPGDSSGTSFQFGATVNASIVPDTAHLFIEGGYQSLEQPTAAPWVNDTSRFNGAPALLSERIPLIGDGYGTALGLFAAPTVRTWKGAHGQARLDWQLNATNHLMARLGFVTWKESNPQLGSDLWNGAGSKLEARDLSGAVGLTTAGSSLANEFRAGFSMAKREWLGSTVPGTVLPGEGLAVGTAPTLPSLFDVKRVDVSDALQYVRGRHRIKGGASLGLISYDQDYRFGSSGLYHFGDLDEFADGRGDFFQVTGTAGSAKFSVTSPGLFIEDTWSASPEIQIQFGARYETQMFPKNKIANDTAWFNRSGVANNFSPDIGKRISPRVSFVWNVRGEWVVRGAGGLFQGELDPSLFAEALLFDGGSTVRRGQGLFPGWPSASDIQAPNVGKRLTLFSPNYRAPRTAKFDFGISRGIRGGTTLTIGGSYSHSDFLLRRTDLNRAGSAGLTTTEGRPVYGLLVKQGSLVSPSPESNRQFDGFDLVSGLAPTGYSDHYEVGVTLERRAGRGLSLEASYYYGKTEDNLVGLREPDPSNQLNPFPDGLPGGGDWSDGRSDLDVTHRVAASAEYRSSGSRPIVIGGRWRWRSGLPFTPGFRPGVDVNGDGGGNNDPVFVDQGGIAGCADAVGGEFAARNSCRESGAQALDLRLAIGLPLTLRNGGAVFFTVDAFNVVSSETGVVDRAVVLVDPAGALGTGANGSVSIPFIANPRFGTLLSRRAEPRLIRFGLKMEY